ncbi:MAG: hypothetical protein NDI69_08380 [Bacteriovoracaceae bacterium]|nr:hypothetical protein [Bacteriovoracaceae bacterium]
MKWLILFSLLGCAQVTSLNLKKHQFGVVPTKIIWFQVAGLEEEQIAMLRFQQTGEKRTSFEDNICVGQTWNYNLYNLRNSAESTFLSQITGKKNIKNNCEDAQLRPIWNYIFSNGYNTGILESGASAEQSLVNFNKCGDQGMVFLSSLYYWIRNEPAPGASTFHYSENMQIKPNQVVYDRTCGANDCGSTILEDFKAVYEKFKKVSQKHLIIVRDFSYLKALDKGDFKKAREILVDIERSYAEALSYADDSNYLVLLTTGDSRFVDMPDQGKQWYQFEKENKNIKVKRTKLTNMVLASGSRAENFCGMYDDAQVFERILSGPKQQGLELKIINPFK